MYNSKELYNIQTQFASSCMTKDILYIDIEIPLFLMVWWANIKADLDDELFDNESLWTVLWLDHGFIHIRYLIVRKSDHLPLFDERFVKYGYNKQQWVEHLRYIGYKFAQLVHGYGIDIPHPLYVDLTILFCSSVVKKQWAATISKTDKKPMKDVFQVYLD